MLKCGHESQEFIFMYTSPISLVLLGYGPALQVKWKWDISDWCATFSWIYTQQGKPTSQPPRVAFLYCVTAKSHIMHMGTHEHHSSSSSLKHIPLLSYIYCRYHTPTWQWHNFTSRCCYARCFVGLLVVTQEPHETGQRTCGSLPAS